MDTTPIGWKDDAERKAWEDVGAKAAELSLKCDEAMAKGAKVEAARHLIDQVTTILQGIEMLMRSLVGDEGVSRLLRSIETSLQLLDNTLQQVG